MVECVDAERRFGSAQHGSVTPAVCFSGFVRTVEQRQGVFAEGVDGCRIVFFGG